MSTVFFFVALFGALCTTAALARPWRRGPMIVPHFVIGWLTGELAMHFLALQAVGVLVFQRLGGLEGWAGFFGLTLTFLSWGGLLRLQALANRAELELEEALIEAFGPQYRRQVDRLVPGGMRDDAPITQLLRPFRMRLPGVERISDIPYGPVGKRHLLDVYRPSSGGEKLPVLFQIHGGGWTIGNKEEQALPLMNHLTQRGWICVSSNYRLSPAATFPEHLIDCKQALAWIKEHIAEYGGDPDFVVVTGGSAGGHLCAMVGLTANQPEFQPGFEDADTSVCAAVPFYGVYDFLDRIGAGGRASMVPMLERRIMKSSSVDERERWEAASPVAQISDLAPPFFVIHGTHDSLVPVESARHFVDALRMTSKEPVAYAELAGAQHAFDVFHSRRCAAAVNAVSWFVELQYARYRASLA